VLQSWRLICNHKQIIAAVDHDLQPAPMSSCNQMPLLAAGADSADGAGAAEEEEEEEEEAEAE
jgi:ribosomal protein L12E/L44/L45/RPP1/RPP2